MSDELDLKAAQSQSNAFIATLKKNYAAKVAQDNQHKKLMLIACCLLLILTIASVGLNYYLFPLKRTEPIIAVVDGSNGIVTSIKYLEPDSKAIESNEALVKSYAYAYVTGRYGYAFVGSMDTLRERYGKVKAFTGSNLSKEMMDEIIPNNPNSPYALYGQEGRIDVKIDSVSMLSDSRVQILFKTRSTKGQQIKVNSYTALGKYIWKDYDGLSVEDRWINPFGFKFVEWDFTQNSSNDALSGSNQTNVSTPPVNASAPSVETPAAVSPIQPAVKVETIAPSN